MMPISKEVGRCGLGKERYRRGAHTVTEFKYHFVWKTKYSYGVLRGDLALRLRDIKYLSKNFGVN